MVASLDDIKFPKKGSSSLPPRTDKVQPDSREIPKKKWVSSSDGAAGRHRKFHNFYLTNLKIAEVSKKNGQVVGEIVFQLDSQILAHVFPGITHLYEFIMSDIPEKIKLVSMNFRDGFTDLERHRRMTQHYLDLHSQLEKCGYKKDFHTFFSEFLINTCDILKQRPNLSPDPNTRQFSETSRGGDSHCAL